METATEYLDDYSLCFPFHYSHLHDWSFHFTDCINFPRKFINNIY